MSLNLAEKIIKAHLADGSMEPGAEAALRIDQTLTQDATGTMAYLEFESMGIDRVKTRRSVAYIDHNTLQSGFENADDHRYIQSVAKKHGIWFSRPGNGICHQVHLERFGVPGMTLIGSDSHTPTAGGLGMLAFGAGGMDVAVAMGGGAYYINMPKVIKVELSGALRPFVTAKDVSLEILRVLSVKGGVGRIIEWGGEGVKSLSVPERATITNMGAELGATSSIFPSDEVTRAFLQAQGREQDYIPLAADPDAKYERVIKINLSELEPLIACPHMPDNVVTVKSLKGTKVDQVCIGSCTNSSLYDMLKAAALLKGRTVADSVSVSVSPGSRQVLSMLSDCGALSDILSSGARLLECACGPCIGMGFSPNSGGVSLRTFNRNFEGRSGTADAKVYLVSPETAVAAALTGEITDPRELGIEKIELKMPESFKVDDSALLPPAPAEEAESIEVLRGPNIKAFPEGKPVGDDISALLTLKVGDNITTDHIMPAGAKILPYRSNIPKLSEFCFAVCDKSFAERAKKAGESIVVGGANYGQGSSREHAALVPLYLGVRAVVAKSFARIHAANLINAGIMPLTFKDPGDYDKLKQGDRLSISGIHEGLDSGEMTLTANGEEFTLCCAFTERQKDMLKAGGLLNYTREGKKLMEQYIEQAAEHFKKLLTEQLARQERMEKGVQPRDFSKADKIVIGIVPGDGIGPIIMTEARRVLEKLLAEELSCGRIEFKDIEGLTLENRMAKGCAIPEDVLTDIKGCDVLLKGPTTTPKGGTLESANVALRRELDLYANVRPVAVPQQNIDWIFFRENTEGEYALGSRGIEVPGKLSMDFKVTTDAGTRRIARAAFDYARANGKKNVAIVTKANIMKKTDGMFSRICHEVAGDYPDIEADDWYIDIMTANLVNEAVRSQFQVFLLPNLYGDIITDEAAQIQGGVGTAGSANIGDTCAMFEAIHGSAPRKIEKGEGDYSNPASILKAAEMLLRHIAMPGKADKLASAMQLCTEIERRVVVTGHRDGASCREFGDYLLEKL